MIVKSSWKSKLIKSLNSNLYSNHNALSIFPSKVKNWRKKTHTHTDPQTNTDWMDFQYLTDRKQNMTLYYSPSPISVTSFHPFNIPCSILVFDKTLHLDFCFSLWVEGLAITLALPFCQFYFRIAQSKQLHCHATGLHHSHLRDGYSAPC